LSCARMEIAQAADFAGLLAWRYYQRTAFPQRRPLLVRGAVMGRHYERFATVVCELTIRAQLPGDLFTAIAGAIDPALQSRGGDGFS
jgi:hypothetical protein